MENGANQNVIYVIILVIILALILFGAVSSITEGFLPDLRYLNSEIRRTSGREKEHYIKKRRRLWLSLLPFFKRH